MNWLLVIHIIALIFWVAGLIYVPALLAASETARDAADGVLRGSRLSRTVYTHALTPVALAAIIAGTLVFVFGYIISAATGK